MKTSDIVNLFSLFHAKYGNRWVSSYPDDDILRLAVKVWTDELSDFPESWVARGVKKWNGDWPPSLPEFKKACLPSFDEIGYDIHNEAIRMAAGDSYNFKRMPADRANIAYKNAYSELVLDMQNKMIDNPVKYDSFIAKQLGVDNGKIC